MKLSDLDIDIPSEKSVPARKNMIRCGIVDEKHHIKPHPSGIYFYKHIPSFEGISVIDYKEMETDGYQKIDILNNTYLDGIKSDELTRFVTVIENNEIDWHELWKYENPYQLSKYPGILKEFKVESVIDVAIVEAIIRPGSVKRYDDMRKFMHTDILLKNKNTEDKKILSDTYGVPVFDEQYKKLGIADEKYRYKKPHSIGYAYVLLVDFLKKTQ